MKRSMVLMVLFVLGALVATSSAAFDNQQENSVIATDSQAQVKDMKSLQTKSAGSIFLHPISQLDISASKIRGMVAQGKNPRYLLPDVVLQMIKVQKIYKTG